MTQRYLHEEQLEKIRKLAEIAAERGQSLAQMAIAWVLRRPEVTSALMGASSCAQLDNSLQALNNLDFADDVLHYADLGFEQMSMEPVVADPSEDYAIKEEDIPAILKEYDRLALEFIKRKKEGRGFNFFHFMLDLKAGPCVAKRMAGCGSGTEYLAVTPWGDLYPCHQFVGNEKFLLGNVDTGVVNTDIRDEFKTCNVYAKPGCKDCFARFYCSGGCSANAYNFSGSINGAYDIGCEMQKKRIECAIMIKAALADDEE